MGECIDSSGAKAQGAGLFPEPSISQDVGRSRDRQKESQRHTEKEVKGWLRLRLEQTEEQRHSEPQTLHSAHSCSPDLQPPAPAQNKAVI